MPSHLPLTNRSDRHGSCFAGWGRRSVQRGSLAAEPRRPNGSVCEGRIVGWRPSERVRDDGQAQARPAALTPPTRNVLRNAPRFGPSADFFGLFTGIASISRDFRLPCVLSRDMSHRSRFFGWLPNPNFPIWTSSGYARAFMLVSARQTLPTSSASTAGQFGADSTSSNEPRLNAPGT
jgi:hypothetical protein